MKSPISGLGRNWKHRKGKTHPSAANVNLKGKKYKLMGCGCCFCIDKREEIRYEQDKKDMKDV